MNRQSFSYPSAPWTLRWLKIGAGWLFCLVTLVFASRVAGAADAATEERLNQLAGRIEDLIAGQKVQRDRINELAKEVDRVREQASKPTGNYASAEDLRRLAESIQEVDRKRLQDYEKIRTELSNLAKEIGKSISAPTKARSVPEDPPTKAATPEKGSYEYVVQSGDTLDAIVLAYKEKNIKITVPQILKANPGLVPEKMKVGQKLNIPAP